MKKRYAVVGVGGRSRMYTNAVTDQFADTCELVAICDNNQGRLELRQSELADKGVTGFKLYTDDQFDQMIAETKPDCVIVTTKDCFHDKYICRAMELGCDTMTEKPMTTDETKCQGILDTQKKTGRKCTVTFNYRYSPPRTQIKDLLMSGLIGEVLSVDFHWLLNTRHGADYFRRWHRNKVNSGGLLVHKATHHFDLVNWWLSSVPERVFASGKRNFYVPKTADRCGLTNRSERCLDCQEASNCPYYLNMKDSEGLRNMYVNNEKYDGYIRDKCVFGGDIDIEDTMHLVVDYRSGASMSYSLHSFMPWEGYVISFMGSKGRIEHMCQESVYINGDGNIPGELVPEGTYTRVFPHFQSPYEVELWSGTGGHGGGDPVLLNDLFGANPPEDKYLRAADHRSGGWSIITGIAGNRSIKAGQPIMISDLVSGLEEPDYPAMPDGSEPIDMAAYFGSKITNKHQFMKEQAEKK